jgi:hypothetical protein
MQNLLLKIPYKFKKSYGSTPEPQTTQDAPWLYGPSLKKYLLYLWVAPKENLFKFTFSSCEISQVISHSNNNFTQILTMISKIPVRTLERHNFWDLNFGK